MKPQFHRNLYLFDGRLSQRIWARGIVTDYSYDGWGSLTNTVYSDGTPTVTLFYDAMGRQTNAVDAAGVTSFAYDDFGSLTNETVVGAAGENTILRHWDSFGRTAGYTLNNVRQTTIGYDAATGRIVTMQTGRTGILPVQEEGTFTWSYLPGSDLKSSLAYPNGLTASWTYDANGQLLQVRNATPTDVISQYDYTYDAAGRRIEIARSGTAMSESRTDTYGYNTRNELISATKLGGPASVPATPEYAYQYDDIGNRITSTDLGTNRTYTANSLNQYSAITTSDLGLQTSSFEPQFDDDGNQTLIQTSTGIWSVQYNGENRPVLWTGGTPSAATNIVMSFDRMGRRVEYREIQTTGASGGNTPTTINTHHRFVYDNYLCIQRLDAANGNAVDFAFVWDVTEPIATRPLIVDKPVVGMAYMSHDGNKNVVELIFTLDSLEIRTHYEYCPFGSQKKASSILSTSTMNACECNPFRFSSEYHDDSLGLVCYNFRHYNTLTGRWLTRDPLRMYEASGIYIGTMNSVMGTDLLGLMVLPISIIPPEPPIDEARRQRCNEIRERFEKWYAQEKARLSKRDQSGKNWVEQLPHCPSELLKVGRKYVSPDESEWKLTWYFGITQKLSNYHPGGIYELRTKYPNKYGGSGNQCIYDGCGKLITNRPGAGTADYSSPEGERSHVRDDVKPFDDARELDKKCEGERGYVDKYYEVRPTW